MLGWNEFHIQGLGLILEVLEAAGEGTKNRLIIRPSPDPRPQTHGKRDRREQGTGNKRQVDYSQVAFGRAMSDGWLWWCCCL